MILGESSKRQNKLKIPSKPSWGVQKPIAKLLLNKLKKDSTILEIGIGQGGVIKLLLKKQSHLNIIGFDINKTVLRITEKMLKKRCKGKYKLLELSQDINLVNKFGKERFDFVISSGSLDYAKNPDNVIKQMKGLLRSGGFAVFTLFDSMSSFDHDGKSPKQRYISTTGIKTWGYRDFYIKQFLKKIGFEIKSISVSENAYRNSHTELSKRELEAIKKNLDHPYEDHFIVLVKKK